MKPDPPPAPTRNDPAAAFDALRREVSLLRRALEGLAAERQVAPDYTPTLTGHARRLAHIEQLLAELSGRPSLQLTPQSLADGIARAGDTVREADRAIIQRLVGDLRSAIGSINGVVEQARTAERQLYMLCAAGLGGLCAGIVCGLALARLAG